MLKLTALTRPLSAGEARRARRTPSLVIASGFSHTTCLPAARICVDLRGVELVGAGDVDDVDRVVRAQLVEALVRVGHADRLGALLAARSGGAQQPDDVDADPAQGLDVHGADEAAADDGRADVGAVRHIDSNAPPTGTRVCPAGADPVRQPV